MRVFVCGGVQNRTKVTFGSTKPKKEDQKTFDDRFAKLLAEGADFLKKEDDLKTALEGALMDEKKKPAAAAKKKAKK